jgi:hypothetical protein
MLLDKDKLHAIGKQFDQSWATGNRLRDMQGPPKMARAEAAHAPASAGASADKAAPKPAPPEAKA